jgi:hypothetical protein
VLQELCLGRALWIDIYVLNWERRFAADDLQRLRKALPKHRRA